MSSNKRPLIGHRELQALVGSKDAVSAKRSPAKRTPAKEDADAAPGFSALGSPQNMLVPASSNGRLNGEECDLLADKTATGVSPKFSGGTSVADVAMPLSPRAGEKHGIEKDTGMEEEEVIRKRYKSENTGSFRDHIRLTRGQAARQKANFLRVDFNYRFRELPFEVKEMIFSLVIDLNCKEIPALVVGLRSRLNDADQELYKAAWGAFCNNNTFVLSRDNSYTSNQSLIGAMPPAVWKTVRNLKITHEYMKRTPEGSLRLFTHDPGPFGSCRYTPCTRCDFDTLTLASQLRSLHLDFGDAYHCIMPIIERTCRFAIENMHLVRLDVTVSNIWGWHTSRYLSDFICKVTDATQETGRLVSVGSKSLSSGPWADSFASETWFWRTTGRRSYLAWIDDRENILAHDFARMAAIYGQKKPDAAREKPAVMESDAEGVGAVDPDATEDDPDLEPEYAADDPNNPDNWSDLSSISDSQVPGNQ